MNVFNIFKKSKKEQKKEIKSVAVVFNIIDHESLVASTIANMVLTANGIKTHMVDIRDVFPITDLYLWIEAGTKESFKNYLTGNMVSCFKSDAWSSTEDILKKSIFLQTGNLTNGICFEETVAGKLYEFLKDRGFITQDDRKIFSQPAVLAYRWNHELSGANDGEEAASYHATVLACYSYYNGKKIEIPDLLKLMEPSQEATDSYFREQKDFGTAMTRRCRYVAVNGQGMQYLTMTGPEVYGVIRRIILSKQKYCHVSEGSYGSIIYGTASISDKILKDRATFNLTNGGGNEQLRRSA